MKIRTDFVTNSSSSSFVVSLNLLLSDGTAVRISSHKDDGDYSGGGCSFWAKDASGKTIASGTYDPVEYCMTEMDMFDPDEIPYQVVESVDISPSSVDLVRLSTACSLKALIAAITKPFGLDAQPTYEDDKEENEIVMEVIEELRGQFHAVIDGCNGVLHTHLKQTSDLDSASVCMEFSGYGEMLASPDEILHRIFDGAQASAVIDVLDEYEEECAEKLRELQFMEQFSDEALESLIGFWKNCDCAPENCRVTQKLRADRKIDLEITWE